MQSLTFLGEVQDGRIQTDQPLADFEGKQVYVTLIAPEEAEGEDAENERPRPEAAEEAETLEDCGRIRLPRRDVSTVNAEIVSVGRRSPRVSTEEE